VQQRFHWAGKDAENAEESIFSFAADPQNSGGQEGRQMKIRKPPRGVLCIPLTLH
jgi:hypothetical protein